LGLNKIKMVEIQKTKTNYLRIEKREWEGNDFIDIREFFIDKETEQKIPTKKGITFNPKVAEQVSKAILEVIKGK